MGACAASSAGSPGGDPAVTCPSSLLESRKAVKQEGKRNNNWSKTRMGSACRFCGSSTA